MKLLMFVLILASLGCAGAPATPCYISTPGSQISVWSFGDSITFGAGAGAACLGYQAILTQDIGGNAHDEGISGTTLDMEFPGIMGLEYSDTVSVNTLLPGFNDVSFYGVDPAHLALFQTDLAQALIHLNGLGKMTLVGTTMYMTGVMQAAEYPLHTNANVDVYVGLIKQTVASLQAQGYT